MSDRDAGTVDVAGALHVAASAIAEIERHAREAWPRECCGLLVGDDARIVAARRAQNDAVRATRYLVHVPDHVAALREARARGLAVVGVYHSHPVSGPVPSRTDRSEATTGLLYLVVGPVRRRPHRRYRGRPGTARRRLRGWRPMSVAVWRLADRNFVRVPFVRTG